VSYWNWARNQSQDRSRSPADQKPNKKSFRENSREKYDPKLNVFIESIKIITDPWRSPLSLPHLNIRNKKKFLAHS
jgi:hypothetical protein